MEADIARTFVESRQRLLNNLDGFQVRMASISRHFDDPSAVFARIMDAWQPAEDEMRQWMAEHPSGFSEESFRIILTDRPAVPAIKHGHNPATAHEAVWRIGQLIHIGIGQIQICIGRELGDEIIASGVRQLCEDVAALPRAMVFDDSLKAERAKILAAFVGKEASGHRPPEMPVAAVTPKKSTTSVKVTVNTVVLGLFHRNPESIGWPLRKLAEATGKSRSAIGVCPAYIQSKLVKAQSKIDRLEQQRGLRDRTGRKRSVRPDEK